MYRHTVTLYNSEGKLLAKIPDKIKLSDFGFSEYDGEIYYGGPVEAVFSNNGTSLWVSNYSMSGKGFDNPGCDGCNGKSYDPGFVYCINTSTFQIEKIVKVGAVPKYMAVTPDDKFLLVSNWSSGDVSIVNTNSCTEIKKVDVGAHPRGIAVSSKSDKAFVTVMGSTKIAEINLLNYEVTYHENLGKSPRHVLISSNDSLLYISLNSSNSILKYNLANQSKSYCKTNAGPRSMILSPDQQFLYVVNYFANTFSKISTDSMKVIEVVETGHHPIGITANWDDAEIWVACYEGKIEIFKDFNLAESIQGEDYFFEEELAYFLNLFESSDEVKSEPLLTNPTENVSVAVEDDEAMKEDTQKNFTPKASKNTLSKFDPGKYSAHVTPSEKVEDTQENPAKTETSVIPTSNTNCMYHVIVGSFSIYENAVSFSQTIKNKGYNGTLINSNKGLTYVSAACFSSREDATNSIQKIYTDVDVKGWVLKN